MLNTHCCRPGPKWPSSPPTATTPSSPTVRATPWISRPTIVGSTFPANAAYKPGPLDNAHPVLTIPLPRLTRKARRLTLHLPHSWPWQNQFSSALARLRALPLPS